MLFALLALVAATFPDWLVVPGSNPQIQQVGSQLESKFQLGGTEQQAAAYYKQLLSSQGFEVNSQRDSYISASRSSERVTVSLRQNGEAVDVKIVTTIPPPPLPGRIPALVPRYPNGRLDRDHTPKQNTLGLKWRTLDSAAQAEAWYRKALAAAGFTIQSETKSPALGSLSKTLTAVHSSGSHVIRLDFTPLFSMPNFPCGQQNDSSNSTFAGILNCKPEAADKSTVELTYIRLQQP